LKPPENYSIFFVYTKEENSMQIQIQKWGNSLAFRIPKSFAIETNIEEGSIVEVSIEEGKLIITPTSKPKYSLDELLSKVNKKNIHDEVNTGKAIGKESW
jgi:antitoxin MazE